MTGGTSMGPGGDGRSEGGGRAWLRALLALPFVFVVAQGSSMMVVYVAAKIGGGPDQDVSAWLEANTTSVVGVLVRIVPVQLALIAGTLLFARATPEIRGLGLGPSRLPLVTTAALVLGTPIWFIVGGLLGKATGLEPTESLRSIQRNLLESEGAAAVVFFVLATVGAALAEELFFRGYVQRALATRFPALLVVLASGVVFATYHFDPLHVVSVLPIGIWIAWLAWRSGSTWVAIAAHFVGNATSTTLARVLGDTVLGESPAEPEPHQLLVLAVLYGGELVALLLGLALLYLGARRSRTSSA